MKIAVINEASCCDKNEAVVAALEGRGHQIINLGMKGQDDPVVLNYLHTSFMSALLLHVGAADFVVGGCGTGLGYAIAVGQYPGVYCGHIVDPLDAWLFVQINDGNAVSLVLNKGYGWAADKALGFIFDALFSVDGGGGYPESRRAVQTEAREKLAVITEATHRPMDEIIPRMDRDLLAQCSKNAAFMELVKNASGGAAARKAFIDAVS